MDQLLLPWLKEECAPGAMRQLFLSVPGWYRGDFEEHFKWLAEFINRGMISVSAFDAGRFELPISLDGYPDRTHDRGGEEHTRLKASSVGMLRMLGAKDADCEVKFGEGSIDVASQELKIAVECGNTSPSRVWECLSCGYDQFWLLPFSSTGVDVLYLFMRGVDFERALVAIEQMEFERIASLQRVLSGA